MENSHSRLSSAAKWLLIFGLFLVANSTYLAAFGDPSLFYVANALLHPLLGIVTAILLVVFIARRRDLLTGAGVDRGRENRLNSIPPPSEPDRRVSRIRLSSWWFYLGED
jgi:hypothetical protein